ncbi:MAG: hypothetical protein ACE5NW_08100 [Acidiferrobacterales bacterium]
MKTDIAAYVNANIEHPEISRLHLFKGASLLSIDGLLNTCPVLNLEAGKTLICAGQPNQEAASVTTAGVELSLFAPD